MSRMLSLFGVLLPLFLALALASPVDARLKGRSHDDDSSDHRSRDDDSSDDDSRDQGPPNNDVPGADNCAAPSGLVSWWPGEGNADDAWGDNDGTLVDVTFSPGKVGQAFDFSGTKDFVQVPDSASLDFSALDSYTIEFWVKTEGVTEGHPTLVEKWANPSTPAYPFAVRLNTGDRRFSTVGPKGTIFCGVFDGSNFPFVWSSLPVDDNEFHHVACVFDGASKSIEVYIDGHLDGFQDYTTLNEVSNGQDLFFGIRGNFHPLTEFNRLLDEISIYAAALSATEISGIFEGGDAGKCRYTSVDIDVKPASQNNLFSRRGPGFIPVAINGSADFSPLDIDFGTLVFETPELGIYPRQGPHCEIVDWNRDAFLDAVCFFKDKPRHWEIGEATGTLTGELFDGTAIEGSDSIRVVSKYKKAHRRHRKTN